MGGASLAFAGKGQFLKDHHYTTLYGREEWIAQGEKIQDLKGWIRIPLPESREIFLEGLLIPDWRARRFF